MIFKNTLSFLIFLIVSQTSLWAQKDIKIRWDLQITDPQYELVNYNLEAKAFKPFLKKTSWRCKVGETESKGTLRLKTLTCDYSVEKTGSVKTIISCSPERPYSEGFLELYDQRKDITFQVMLTCRVL